MRPGLWLAALAALTAIRLAAAALVPLAPDEAYYWIWSQHLQAGYYDDAPLIALWIQIGAWLAGPSSFGIRLLSPLGAALGSVLIWRAGEDLFPGREVGMTAGVTAALLLNATIVLGAGSVVTTPDTPLLLFWTATIAALARWLRSGEDRWWIAAGAAAGLALDAKYTGLLLLAAVGLWMLSIPEGRRALARPLPWAGLGLALLLFLPVILWNADHRWASFLKQGGRVTQFHAASALHALVSLIGGQIGLATPGVAVLLALGVWRACRAATAEARLVFLLVLVPGLVFLEHVVSGLVQANWPAIAYPGAALAAGGMADRGMRRWLPAAVALGFALTFIIYVQAITGVFSLPPRRDPTAFQLAGWPGLARQVAAAAARDHAVAVTAPDYATLAELAHDLPPGPAIAGFTPRWETFDLPRRDFGPTLLVQPARRGAPQAAFPAARLLGRACRRRGGQRVERYDLYAIRGLRGASVIRSGS